MDLLNKKQGLALMLQSHLIKCKEWKKNQPIFLYFNQIFFFYLITLRLFSVTVVKPSLITGACGGVTEVLQKLHMLALNQ